MAKLNLNSELVIFMNDISEETIRLFFEGYSRADTVLIGRACNVIKEIGGILFYKDKILKPRFHFQTNGEPARLEELYIYDGQEFTLAQILMS
jgi:hypothetical protein